MKRVLFYDETGITKEYPDYNGGGFFKYYELEQYEEALVMSSYADSDDLILCPGRSPYNEYVFFKDQKMLDAFEIDYKNKQVIFDKSKPYNDIDFAETISQITGKWIKRVLPDKVIFEDDTVVDLDKIDYKLLKPLIWW